MWSSPVPCDSWFPPLPIPSAEHPIASCIVTGTFSELGISLGPFDTLCGTGVALEGDANAFTIFYFRLASIVVPALFARRK